MKAKHPGTCALCAAPFSAGDEIAPTTTTPLPPEKFQPRRSSWAHARCDAAWPFQPEPNELVPCPYCQQPMAWKRLWRHLEDGCLARDGWMLPYQIRLAMRDVVYRRFEEATNEPGI